jgi:hypothetical protein
MDIPSEIGNVVRSSNTFCHNENNVKDQGNRTVRHAKHESV